MTSNNTTVLADVERRIEEFKATHAGRNTMRLKEMLVFLDISRTTLLELRKKKSFPQPINPGEYNPLFFIRDVAAYEVFRGNAPE